MLVAFVFLVATSCVSTAHSKLHVANCCQKTAGSCRSACEQLHLETISDPETRAQRLLDVNNFCSPHLVSFWRCMNETERTGGVLDDRRGWAGKVCCTLAQSERCHRACKNALNPKELTHHCRHSDEIAMFTCIDKLQRGEDCCGMARDSECHAACRRYLIPGANNRVQLAQSCGANILHCVNNVSRPSTITNPHKYLHCCERSTDHQCRETCRHTLKTMTTDQDIMESMQGGGCGPVSLHDRLWQCFLVNDQGGNSREMERSQIFRLGLDSVKLHCCLKAVTTNCKRLCLKTFSTEWVSLWESFDKECITQAEQSLAQCIDEVEEPCELGCEGLSFCANFNNRPTELFRSCNRESDDAAKNDVTLWYRRGSISLPMTSELYIKNISQCSPIWWETIACTLQIKPCHRKSHANRICREDCYKLLSICLDWEMMSGTTSAAEVCSKLSPTDPTAPCISLNPFLKPSMNPYQEAVTRPCKSEPCSPSQVCQINRTCEVNSTCQPFSCSPGCRLGEVSQHIVPAGTFVRIPIVTGSKGGHKLCQCSQQGTMTHCHLMNGWAQDFCKSGTDRIEHGATFQIANCQMCVCYAGERICNKKKCPVSTLGVADVSFTSLPCNCPLHHIPVCGSNGVTYPSSCSAKCVELSDGNFKYGACVSIDPCSSKPCADYEICVPRLRVCLSLIYTSCPQYECVNPSANCNQHPDPVCDTTGHQHHNLCYLMRQKKELAYHGPCIPGCRMDGEVCGIDGNTYSSECVALGRMIAVDYRGKCITVGMISKEAKVECAKPVKCPELPQSNCEGFTPPGACCPICTGALRILYSHKQIDRMLGVLNGHPMELFTVEAILKGLQRQVKIAECTIRGLLTIEDDILVMVMPTSNQPSQLQLEACIGEAEKLAILIESGSPRIVSDASLSVLAAATLVHVPVSHSSLLQPLPLTLIVPFLLLWIKR